MRNVLRALLVATLLCAPVSVPLWGQALAQSDPAPQNSQPHVIGMVHFIPRLNSPATTAFYRDVFGMDVPLRVN